MSGRTRIVILLAIVSGSSSLSAQSGKLAQSDGFAFLDNQFVYIAAFHNEHDHQKSGVNRLGVGEHLAAAQVVRREFERSGAFKPIDKPSDADYVFVVYVHDRTAEGIAVAPQKYHQTKTELLNGDLDPLRDAAYSRTIVGPFKLPTLGRMSAQLVKKFHEDVMAHRTAIRP